MELGVFVKCPHPEMIEALGIAGMDFAVVDMEHTPLGPRDLYPLVLAAERRDLRLVVRVPENAPHWFRWALDLGVKEIQVPNIRLLNDGSRAVAYSQFGPQGQRGLCRFVRAANFSAMNHVNYLSDSKFRTHLILQIEDADAVSRSDQILDQVEEVSVLIGPYDLSASFGVPGDIRHPSVIGGAEHVIQCCKLRSIPVGVFTDTFEEIEFWRQKGVDFIEYASDLHLLMGAARDLKQWVNHHDQ